MKNLLVRIISAPAVRKALVALFLAVAAAAGYDIMSTEPGVPADAPAAPAR